MMMVPKKNRRGQQKAVPFQQSRKTRNPSGTLGPRPPQLHANEIVERSIPGFLALKYRAKLRYYDTFTLSTGASGVAGNYVYSANGLYDPDITGTGHQPMPFDQLMLSFEHYTVVGARCRVSFNNASTTNTVGIAIAHRASSTTTTSQYEIVEDGVAVVDRLSVSPGPTSCVVLDLPVSIGKFGGVPQLLNNPSYQGSAAANPVEQSYFHVSAWCPSAATVSGIVCEIYLEYDAWFTEPRRNSASMSKALLRLIQQENKSKA